MMLADGHFIMYQSQVLLYNNQTKQPQLIIMKIIMVRDLFNGYW
jgi:hypothetical protein